MPKIYLCGPITGLDYKGAVDWRDSVKADLNRVGLEGLSPMRGKDYLANEKSLGFDYNNTLFSSNKSITVRDRFDTLSCDAVIANLLGSKRVSIGSMIELGWADAMRTPIILVMEKEGNVHEHGMVEQLASFRVESLDEAMLVVKALFNV